MAGYKVLTDLKPDQCLQTAWRTTQERGFKLSGLEPQGRTFLARKGNWLLNHLGGNLFTPYCRFKFTVAGHERGSELILELDDAATVPTGKIGAWRIGRQEEKLIAAITAAVEKEGGHVLERTEF